MERRSVKIRPRRRHCDFSIIFFQPFFFMDLPFPRFSSSSPPCIRSRRGMYGRCCDEGYCPTREVIILGKKKAGELSEGRMEGGRRETRSVRKVEVKVKEEKEGYEEELRYMVSSRSSRGGR